MPALHRAKLCDAQRQHQNAKSPKTCLQGWHVACEVAPVAAEYVPAGQLRQLALVLDPATDEYVPLLQGTHPDAKLSAW